MLPARRLRRMRMEGDSHLTPCCVSWRIFFGVSLDYLFGRNEIRFPEKCSRLAFKIRKKQILVKEILSLDEEDMKVAAKVVHALLQCKQTGRKNQDGK